MLMNVTDGASLARVDDDVTGMEEHRVVDGAAAVPRCRVSVASAYSPARRGIYVKQRDAGPSDVARSTTRRVRPSGHVAWASLPSSAPSGRDQRHVEPAASIHDNSIQTDIRIFQFLPETANVSRKKITRYVALSTGSVRLSHCSIVIRD